MKIIADENIPFVAECFSRIGDVSTVSGRMIEPDMVKDADILLVRSITSVDERLLSQSKVKFVATATIGTDHIDQDYLRDRGIGFAFAPGSNANSVAEYIVAALLTVARKHRLVLDGKSIGIVGVGNVGSRVAQKCRALGMEVLLNDPPLKRVTGDEKYRKLEDLFDCDFITIHTPLTLEGSDKTYHLCGEDFFNSLTPGAFFINSARGAVTDTEAIKNALKNKTIKGAILDVWENEPNIDNELLLTVDLSTPHIAGYSYDGKVGGMMMIYGSVCEYFGLAKKAKIEDFLPVADVAEITVDPSGRLEEDIIHDTVQQIYVINRDDFNMREILIVDPAQRGSWFDGLRRDYAVRREFGNTRIVLDDTESTLAKKLRGIGFKV